MYINALVYISCSKNVLRPGYDDVNSTLILRGCQVKKTTTKIFPRRFPSYKQPDFELHGMTAEEIQVKVQHKYEQFCNFRNEIQYVQMPDFRVNLFSHTRRFSHGYFEEAPHAPAASEI